MSPRQKRLAILSALGLVPLAFYYMSLLLYATLFLVVCCFVGYCYTRKRLPARSGLNPRAGLNVPFELPRWLWGASGVSVAQQRRIKSSGNKSELWFSERTSRGQFGGTGIYRQESETNSLRFSPRDFLMGSYIGKPESPTSACGRRIAGRNPREQLREKLSSPNHAVYTPNRRLSFAGEPTGAANRFVITPQRHLPLPQLGVPSLGLLRPVRWEGFEKKPMLRPRNPLGLRYPVTVKIAQPGRHRTFSCAIALDTPEDHCSTESVLKSLKAKCHKRVTEEDTSFTTEQKNKRSRNDSGGSAHFAFESVLPNGTPSQLVPKPGSLKIGSPSQLDESTMKRSRTSSISSGSGIQAPKKTPGSCTSRNAIYSSYSSTGGLPKKRRLPLSPPVSSSGSSRPQTPEGPSKSLREEDGQSPSSTSSVKSDQEAPDKISDTSKLSSVPKVPVTTSSGSTGSGRKRRKIQLVPSKRDDVIPLPSTPQLGYTITVKDMDEDRKAAFEIVKKMMMDSAPEPVNPVSSPGSAPPESSLFTNSSASAATLSSLLAAPLSVNLDASASGAAKTNSSQHLKNTSTFSTTCAANTTTVSLSTTSVQPTALNLPPVSQPQSSSVDVTQPSAFTRAPGQVSEASSDTPTAVRSGFLGSAIQFSTPTTASNPVTTAAPASSSSPSVSNSNPLLASGFKPIFAVTTTPSATSAPESKPVQTFKPIFATNIAGAGFIQHPSLTTINPSSAAASSNTSSVFGGSISSATIAPSVFPGLANSSLGTTSTGSTTINTTTTTTQTSSQPALKSLFGNWSTPTTASTSSVSAPTPNTGGTFQFGTVTTTTSAAPNPAASTTASGSSTFTFGATKPDLEAASQKVFPFVQTASSQSTTTASFGGFATTSTSSTTGSNSSNTDTTTATTTSQSIFAFGKSSFQSPAAQSTFGSSAPKPAFGSTTPQPIFGSQAAQPAFGSSAGQAAQPAFGSSAAQAAQPAFGSSAAQAAQPAFGPSAPQPAFGPSAPQSAQPAFGPSAPQSAQPAFGPSAPQSAQPTFGSSAPQSAQPTFGSSAPQSTQPTFGSSAPQSTQPTFGSSAPQSTFGSSAAKTTQPTFGSSAAQPTFGSSAAQLPKPFTFGNSGTSSTPATNPTPAPFTFGTAAVTTAASFGTPAKPAFGAGTTGFTFGGTTAPSAAPSAPPSFGASSQTQSTASGTFTFGSTAPQQTPAPVQAAPSGFNFGAAVPQFGTPLSNNPAPQMGGFNFGAAATDKPAFGSSTPSFGQTAATGPIPFGSPGTPVQGFNAVPFGSPSTPSFSIGAGSKPSGARQRLQARRQHNRKK